LFQSRFLWDYYCKPFARFWTRHDIRRSNLCEIALVIVTKPLDSSKACFP
jgi:hypothetical protein